MSRPLFMRVAAADPVVEDAQLDVARIRLGFGDGFEPEIAKTVVNRSVQILSPGRFTM